ncbi:pyridoxamine 5'-phosphate oxidase family protein [Jannaschia rubra]|uniref:PPOX class probable FMN-dependent enzyme, family n=1 Tax=Jannaschia rubra TaxID=282197 RepID=A0A0M6XTQ8_9RHOB|nr:pyridoxamine 5'-phosphate oxidase family protein [Jannaschia rubra]CTQ33633.1 PPOX class probable FMN-dependent enzyme, family [Jannaschia rubra]SFG05329.1 Pyridoxamine 5'-phosphate oxidase [Jannaschia rubra]
MSDPFADLGWLLDHVWTRLERGARDASDPFRLVTLATTGPHGAEARMVGLRVADRMARTVEVHTDLRTAKVRAAMHDPRAALLAWDTGAQVQLRLSVMLEVIAADADRWSRIPAEARLNYGTDPAPGAPVDAPRQVTRTPDMARFAALQGKVFAIDILSLAHDPHRRARFDGTGGRWIAP